MLRINMAWGIDFVDALELLFIEQTIFFLKLFVLRLENLIVLRDAGLIPVGVGCCFSVDDSVE